MSLEILSSDFLDAVMLLFMAVTALAIARIRNLFAVVMLSGIYSLLGATLYVILDAVDVAFTEAAVGAGASTVLMIGTLGPDISTRERHAEYQSHQRVYRLCVCRRGAGLCKFRYAALWRS